MHRPVQQLCRRLPRGAISFPDQDEFLDALQAAKRPAAKSSAPSTTLSPLGGRAASPVAGQADPSDRGLDRKLYHLLQEWRVEDVPLPLRFSQQVWQRIRSIKAHL